MTEPHLITSAMSQRVTVEGQQVSVEIIRLEDDPAWALEIVNEEGTSVVWDDTFDTDQEAWDEARQVLDDEGLTLFREEAEIIPFPTRT
jgi:hypothetical protein